VWVRARPRLAAVLDGCSSQPASVRERRVPSGGACGREHVARPTRGSPLPRRLHGEGGTGVVGMCSAESWQGLGGVYPDTAKVASHARAVGT
jgi:hypothetical protein